MEGQTVSHYRILEKIGEGGMGEVYLAEDTRLFRKVALKFLPDYLQRDEVAQKRFLREARSAAALDHPYICKIYETSEVGGQSFIAMEYVKGQTMKEKLLEGPVPLKQTLQIGMEIAEALEEAHKAGIAHRDLKPANIMLASGGHVKVMDFGLAKKVVDEDGTEQDITSALTREGTTLGTLAYMSPEQLRGEEIDARSDIFSFGILIYEMLIGKHPFRRAKPMETSAAILTGEPEFPAGSQTGAGIGLIPLIQRMLTKEPSRRCQTAEEVHATLHKLQEEAVSSYWTWNWPYWGGGLAALVILVVALAKFLSAPTAIPTAKIGHRLTSDGKTKYVHALATNGRLLYYSQADHPVFPNRGTIHQVSVEGGESVAIDPWPGEERLTFPWDISPDQTRLLVTSSGPGERDPYFTGMPLWIVTLPGDPKRLGDIYANRAYWSPNGQAIAYSSGDGLYVGPSADSDFKKILTAKNNVVVYSWSPDGKQISYGVCYFDEERVQLWVVGADGGDPERLFAEREDLQYIPSAEWTPDGNWLVFRNGVPGDLWAVRRHKGLLDRSPQEPVPLTDSLEHFTGFTLSPDGKKIYAIFNPRRTELVRYRDEINSWVPYTFPINPSSAYLDFSSDAQWVTYVQIPEFTLWRIRVDGTQRRQLTDRGMYVRSPQWSPDGKSIAFSAGPNPWGLNYRVYVVSREGGPPQRVIREEYSQQNGDWSSQGKLLVSSGRAPVRPGEKSPSQSNPQRLVDVWTGTFEELPDSEGKRESACSPDGRYVASCQVGSGELEIFDTKAQIWTPLEGCRGGRLTWSADSSYLYFCGSDRRLYRVHTENRGVEEVARLDDLGPHPFPSDQWWFGFGPDGILLTIRWLEREEIYALDFEAH